MALENGSNLYIPCFFDESIFYNALPISGSCRTVPDTWAGHVMVSPPLPVWEGSHVTLSVSCSVHFGAVTSGVCRQGVIVTDRNPNCTKPGKN